MLIAYNSLGNTITANEASKSDIFYCFGCGETLFLKNGSIKIAHFAHRTGSDCNTFSEGETSEHLLGKEQLLAFFKFNNPVLEYYFNNLKQRPDILLNNKSVVEFQCSPISNQRLTERLAGYKKIGYRSIWILGKPYLKRRDSHKKMKQFLRYNVNVGFYLLYWDVLKNQMEIHYQIRFVFGKLIYQIKIVKNMNNLNNFFNQSGPSNRSYSPMFVKMNLIKQTTKLQQKVIYNQSKKDLIQNLCYQNGYNLVGYPLEMDYPIVEHPILGKQLIRFKIALLMFLKMDAYTDFMSLINQVNLFMKIDQQFLMIDPIIIKRCLFSIFSYWQQYGIVRIKNYKIKLVNPPRWYSSYHLRISAIERLVK